MDNFILIGNMEEGLGLVRGDPEYAENKTVLLRALGVSAW
jgi:hypothetical protein